MRARALLHLLGLALASGTLPSLLFAQTSSPAGSSTQATQDPVALQNLGMMNLAAGWSGTNLPADAEATGIVSIDGPNGPRSRTVTFKARPGLQLRSEFSDDGSVIVVNGAQGALLKSSRSQPIPGHSALSMAPPMFPFFGILADINSGTVSATTLGTATLAGQTVVRVELMRAPTNPGPAGALLARASRIVLDISLASHLPLALEFEKLSVRNPSSGLPVVCYFSDFRNVNGLSVPFHIEEFAGTQRLWILDLQTVQFNVGLSDADFAVQ